MTCAASGTHLVPAVASQGTYIRIRKMQEWVPTRIRYMVPCLCGRTVRYKTGRRFVSNSITRRACFRLRDSCCEHADPSRWRCNAFSLAGAVSLQAAGVSNRAGWRTRCVCSARRRVLPARPPEAWPQIPSASIRLSHRFQRLIWQVERGCGTAVKACAAPAAA